MTFLALYILRQILNVCQDIAEILLKVLLNTITPTLERLLLYVAK